MTKNYQKIYIKPPPYEIMRSKNNNSIDKKVEEEIEKLSPSALTVLMGSVQGPVTYPLKIYELEVSSHPHDDSGNVSVVALEVTTDFDKAKAFFKTGPYILAGYNQFSRWSSLKTYTVDKSGSDWKVNLKYGSRQFQ